MPTIDELKSTRLRKLENLSKLGINAYPATVKRTHTVDAARGCDGADVAVTGRIVASRGHGKIQFLDIVDGTGKLQVVLRANEISKDAGIIVEFLDIGDFIAVQGAVGKTQAGEVSVFAKDIQLITKTVRPLPDSWYGLKDVEERYRQRYLDMIINPEVRARFVKRSRIIETIRSFLNSKGYLEVETPTLQPVYGGGFARPFKTHHNELGTDLYLRISDEMYLKRLIVGGLEKVYEITKVFRNEGIDHDHNPEFTMFEAQIAFEDYTYGMDIIEEIIEHTAKEVLHSTEFTYQGIAMSVKRPWARYRLVEAIQTFTGVTPYEWDSTETAKRVIMHLDIPESKLSALHTMRTVGEMIAFTFEECVEEKLIQPTIIYDYPIEVSPLAKKCDDPRFTQRFEMFAFGSELGNNYSELNDPVDLLKRFVEEKKREEAGFDEAHQTDYDYLTAIEHGFPPTCGIAIGIDRLVMLLTDAKSIKEVIAFPTLRPEADTQKKSSYDYREKQVVVVLDESLESGKAANALGHIAFSAGRFLDDSWIGKKDLKDADGVSHTGIGKYPFIILSASATALRQTTEQARAAGLFTVEYPQEMFDTSTDGELVSAMAKAKSGDLQYRAVLIAGKTSDIKPVTKGLPLYGNGKTGTKTVNAAVKNPKPAAPELTRTEAVELLHAHMNNQNLRRHCYAVGYAMRALAEKLGGDPDVWEVLGILHDADWEETKDTPHEHTKRTLAWLSEKGITDGPIVRALMSHNRKHTSLAELDGVMEWALETVDELTGFIVAVALVRPEKKLETVTVDAVMKKWKAKEFAKAVDRNQIALCEEKLGVDLPEFVSLTLTAMQAHHDELGL